MSASKVVLWRHGQTDWNLSGRFQGQLDIPLNATGIDQAKAAAPFLAALSPVAIVSSDLGRAVSTAQQLSVLTGKEIQLDSGLQEVNVGQWAGLVAEEAYQLDPGFKLALDQGRDYRRSATGETATELGRRVAAAIERQAQAIPDGQTLVCVSHGLAIRMAVATLLGLDYGQSLYFSGPRNCSWAVLEPGRSSRWRLLSYNNTAPKGVTVGLSVDDAW